MILVKCMILIMAQLEDVYISLLIANERLFVFLKYLILIGLVDCEDSSSYFSWKSLICRVKSQPLSVGCSTLINH